MGQIKKKSIKTKKIFVFIVLIIIFFSYTSYIIQQEFTALDSFEGLIDMEWLIIQFSEEEVLPPSNDEESEVFELSDEEIDLVFSKQKEKMRQKALDYESIGAYSKAHDVYIKIIGIDKFNEDAWKGIINSLEKLGKLDEAKSVKHMMEAVLKNKNG